MECVVPRLSRGQVGDRLLYVRDIPTIQLIVVILAAFYVFMNILTDVVALLATPRRRLGR